MLCVFICKNYYLAINTQDKYSWDLVKQISMFQKILSFIYKIRRSILLRLQSAYVITHAECDGTPNIKGNIFLNATGVKLGKNVTLYPGAYLWGNNITCGSNVDIGINTIIYAKKKVSIGDNTLIAGQCYIIDSNHGTKAGELIKNQPDDVADEGIYIGRDVWIAAQCVILKGAKINDGAIIGAQSLVNSEIPANAIAVGTPAKVIGYRK